MLATILKNIYRSFFPSVQKKIARALNELDIKYDEDSDPLNVALEHLLKQENIQNIKKEVMIFLNGASFRETIESQRWKSSVC